MTTKILGLSDSHINHGSGPSINATVIVEHEISISPHDILVLINNLASDSMAKVINTLGSAFNRDQFAECHAADELNEEGRTFINDMYYFIQTKGGEDANGE